MYAQVTTRCNMHCGHCGFSCTRKGSDMDWYTFVKSFQLCDAVLTIGGGEPTLWGHFSYMLDWFKEGMLNESLSVIVITNGTRVRNTKKAVKLMEYYEEYEETPRFRITLSCKDEFHDDNKIHDDIYSYFNQRQRSQKLHQEFIRSVSRIIPQGRASALDLGQEQLSESCLCPDMVCIPNGDLYQCGCEKSRLLGSVFDPASIDYPEFSCVKEEILNV